MENGLSHGKSTAEWNPIKKYFCTEMWLTQFYSVALITANYQRDPKSCVNFAFQSSSVMSWYCLVHRCPE